ncbi:glycosyltransferase family 64 protein C4 isoform X2 [Jatropha curcas]|uniref:glycosyltransferase family 64 protein C4 isoform X2 n=1 Tax=Jatropha curcas TaxID=180498 RepID=UPI001894240A|nr:glycosyltransferase family 64 protein C4 isoform X2 [Jatropha curcas]
MSTIIGIREVIVDDLYSPAKEKAAGKGSFGSRWAPLLRRARQLLVTARVKLVLSLCALCVAVFMISWTSSFMGWIPEDPSPSLGGYTVLINTWKGNSLLKQSVTHYASCGGTDALHVVWSATDQLSENLQTYLKRVVFSKSQTVLKPNFKLYINKEDYLKNRFKPFADLRTHAVFSVDDDVIVPCSALDFAFSVWQSAPSTMVGFVPRIHLLDGQKNGVPYYKYGGWWSVWWTGAYSIVLSKAAFFHKKYLDLYTHSMSPSIQDYVSRERDCEDIAMSLLVANATGAPPIWVKGFTSGKGIFGFVEEQSFNLSGFLKARSCF